jgi:hypothetical protein
MVFLPKARTPSMDHTLSTSLLGFTPKKSNREAKQQDVLVGS